MLRECSTTEPTHSVKFLDSYELVYQFVLLHFHLIYVLCVHACTKACHYVQVEVRGHPAGVSSLLRPCGSQGWSSGLTTGVFTHRTISALLVCPFRAHAFITVSSQGEFKNCLPNSGRYTFSPMFCSSQFLVFSILCSTFIFVAELVGFGIAKKRDLTNSHL